MSESETDGLYGSQGSRTAAAAAEGSSEGESVKSEENGGGGRKAELLAEASDAGYCGGGGCCRWRELWPGWSLSAPERVPASSRTSSVKRTSSSSVRSPGRPASSSTLRRLGKMGRAEDGEDSERPFVLDSRGGYNLAVGDGHQPFATGLENGCLVEAAESEESIAVPSASVAQIDSLAGYIRPEMSLGSGDVDVDKEVQQGLV